MERKIEEIIKEFYNTVISQTNLNLTYEQVEVICKYPFYYIKNIIINRCGESIHLKYLGKFLIYPGSLLGLVRRRYTTFKNGDIDKETVKKELDKYIPLIKEKTNKYNDELESIENELNENME